MRLQIRYRTRNQLGTINLPSGRLQTSLYRADGLAKQFILSAAGCRPLTTALPVTAMPASSDAATLVLIVSSKDFPIFVSCMPSRYTYVVVGHVELHINDIKSDFSIKIIFMPLMAKYKG